MGPDIMRSWAGTEKSEKAGREGYRRALEGAMRSTGGVIRILNGTGKS